MEKNIKKNEYISITESACYTIGMNNIVHQLYFNKNGPLWAYISLCMYV